MRSDVKFPAMMILGLGVAVVCAQETPAPKETAPPKTPKPATPAKVTPRNTAQSRYFEEQFRQLRGEIEGIKEAYDLQLRKAVTLEAEVKQLRTTNETFKRELALKFAALLGDEAHALLPAGLVPALALAFERAQALAQLGRLRTGRVDLGDGGYGSERGEGGLQLREPLRPRLVLERVRPIARLRRQALVRVLLLRLVELAARRLPLGLHSA